MARITTEEFNLMHEAVTEWKEVLQERQSKFLRDYGTDETKWDKHSVDLFNLYLDDWKNAMKAQQVVWETLHTLLKEVDE